MTRPVLMVVGLGAGAVMAMGSAFVHADRIKVGGFNLPYGVVLAIATILVVQLWLTRNFQSRTCAAGYALGWVGITVVLALIPTAQDLILPNQGRTWAYLGLGAVAVSMGVSLPVMRRPHILGHNSDTD